MQIVILMGGKGVRLWPLSNEELPKQFLHFGDGESLLQKTLKRISAFPLAKEIILSTNHSYTDIAKAQIEKIGLSDRCHILLEPERRNTAPAIALAVKYLEEKLETDPDEPVLILPADHFISEVEKFFGYLRMTEEAVKREKIALFGIKPTRPETGFGYVMTDSLFMDGIYSVKQFCEKPNLKRAKEYILRSDCLWNAGIFCFTPRVFWRELEEHAPELFEAGQGGLEKLLQQFWQLPPISIDKALMEKSKQIVICPMDLNWFDVGSWDNVYEAMEKDKNQNVKIGNVIDIETTSSLIMGGKKLISTIGLKDMLIVETDQAIFIAKKGHSQKIRELMQELKEGNSSVAKGD